MQAVCAKCSRLMCRAVVLFLVAECAQTTPMIAPLPGDPNFSIDGSVAFFKSGESNPTQPNPHPGAALQPRPHAHAGRERAGDTERARMEYRRPPPGRRAGRPRRDTPPPPPPHRAASRGGPGPHPPRQGGWSPPAREGSRSATRPPAPAAGSHGGREEQASPRLRTGTPHRSYPEKPGEHEPEWYGGPRPPWTAQRH